MDGMQKFYHFDKKYVVDTFSFDQAKNPLAGVPKREEDISCFSDGSYTGFGKCGSGVVICKIKQDEFSGARHQIPTNIKSIRHLEENTIFIAEIDGIMSAARLILDNYVDPLQIRSACIYVDSQAALKAVDNPEITSKWVLKAVMLLDKVAELLPDGLKLRWVKAHQKRVPGEPGPDGYPDTFDYNDRADEAAKDAANQTRGALIDKASLPGKQMSTIKRHIFLKIREQWSLDYADPNGNKRAGIAKMRHFRNFVPKPTTSFSNKVMDLLGNSRLKFSVFTKLISGFDDLAKYQFKLGQSESPQCTFCNAEDEDAKEDFMHLLTECPALLKQAAATIKSFSSWKVDPSTIPVGELVSFISAIDLFDPQ